MRSIVLLTLVGTLLAAPLAAGQDPAGPKRLMNFADAKVGELPRGWTAAKTGTGEGSVWKIVEDKDAPGGPKVLAQTARGPSPLFNLCIAEGTSYADVDLSVAFKAVAGEIDQGGGLVWRYQDPQNYYVVRQNPLEDNFRVYKVVAGKRVQLASDSPEAPAGKWHTIRVVHKGDHIQCYLNGELSLDVKDKENTFKGPGKVGLWTKADAQTSFADMKVSGK
jgi:hypothetical protein